MPTFQVRGGYWIRHAILPLLLAAVCVAVFELTDLDRRLIAPFYDPVTGKFPLRSVDLFSFVFRSVMKGAVITFGVVVVIGLLISIWRPALEPWRWTFAFVIACLALCPLAVAGLKYSSCVYCPWDLEWYGGTAPHVGVLGCGPAGMEKGQCFPGGHSSGGYALFALYFAHRVHAPRRARLWLVFALAYGTVMGVSRMMQGAHFLSHNVASAFVCWFVCLALYEVVLRRHDEARFAPRS